MTLDSYSNIMEDAISVPVAKGLQPQRHSARLNALFFVAYIVVTAFVMLNLFVGTPPKPFQPVGAAVGYGTHVLRRALHITTFTSTISERKAIHATA
jgi:hypothetical protein